MYRFEPAYPTVAHEKASASALEYFSGRPNVKAVLLTNSCARGKATNDSCLDMLILLPPGIDAAARKEMDRLWCDYRDSATVFQELKGVGKYAEIDLEYSDGVVRLSDFHHGWTSGPDHFELEIGNLFAYSVPLWEADGYFRELKDKWLPYYDENLCAQRLDQVLKFFRNNIDHIDPFLRRRQFFAAFKRLYNAFGELLQALFIARRTYPIAYDKHVREQIVDILRLSDLYPLLPPVLEIQKLESMEILGKARLLVTLMDRYVILPSGQVPAGETPWPHS